MTVYAIGDIHGCRDPLLRLLDIVAVDARAGGEVRPRLIFLGSSQNLPKIVR